MQRTILVLDDSKTQLSFYRIQFTKAGYNVITAENAKEAFVKIFEYQPDIIISDINMPNIGGFQFCKFLKQHIILKLIPILLYTSTTDMHTLKFWANEVQADSFLTKDKETAIILQDIDRLIREKSPTENVKNILKQNQDKALSIFNENHWIPDSEWIKQTLANRLSLLFRFFDNSELLICELFNIISQVLPYNLFFLAFGKRKIVKQIDLYTNENNYKIDKEVLYNLSENFIKDTFGETRSFNTVLYETNIDSSEQPKLIEHYNKHLILPIKIDNTVVAGIGLYWETTQNLECTAYYNDLLYLISEILQSKIHYESINFLVYKNMPTGIHNRIQFLESLEIELARKNISKTPVSLAILSFTNYDEIAQKYGVDTANLAVEKSIREIISKLRVLDRIYRYDYQTIIINFTNTNAERSSIPVLRVLDMLKNTKHQFKDQEFIMSAVVTISSDMFLDVPAKEFFEKVFDVHKQKLTNNMEQNTDESIS